MKNIRILIAGAVAILATASATPIVGHAEVVTTQPQGYNVEAHYDADSYGVSDTNFSESKSYGDVYAWKHTQQYNDAIANKSNTTPTISTTTTPARQGLFSAGWNTIDIDHIYFCDENGNKKIGWFQDCGDWYYANSDGTLVTDKWIQDGSNWYYIAPDGFMFHYGCYSGYYHGYYFDKSGVYQSSLNDNSKGYNNVIFVDTSSTSTIGTELSFDEFQAKKASGHIGARVMYSSTGGGPVLSELHFYLQ